MKKTLLALSVLVASTAANAGIELYNQDGASVTLGGDLEVVYVKGTAEDSSVEQQIQDADLKIDIRKVVNDELSVGAYWEFQGDDNDTTEGGSANMGDVYFAFYTASYGSVKIGDVCSIADDLGVGEDYQFGVTAAVDQVDACADEAVRWDYSNDQMYVSAAYRDNQRSDAVADLADIKVGFMAGDFDLMGYYGTSNSAEQDTFALEARYGLDAMNLALGYYDVEDAGNVVALAADYTMDKWLFAAGVNLIDADASDDDTTEYFLNAGYAVASATTLYAEIGGNDVDGSELGYAVGAKVEF
ncbi:porin [Vibrio sp. MA40-2]|uniref:porin n=1 Tax=Vibrio sp. MA40-2 TaxID=3391828 RepID=UPI0039A55384